jgi:hypothetical protein
MGSWISIGRQPPIGLTPSTLYSSIISWFIFARICGSDLCLRYFSWIAFTFG